MQTEHVWYKNENDMKKQNREELIKMSHDLPVLNQ